MTAVAKKKAAKKTQTKRNARKSTGRSGAGTAQIPETGTVARRPRGEIYTPRTMTKAELALEFRTSVTTVATRLNGVPADEVIGNYPRWFIVTAAQHLLPRKVLDALVKERAGGDGQAPMDAETEVKFWQAREKELNVREKAGQLLRDDDVRQVLADALRGLAAGLEAIPDRLDSMQTFTEEQLTAVRDLVDEVRTVLADDLESKRVDDVREREQ